MPAALLNHLWQSSAFAALAALAAWALRGHQARVRFWIWMAASLKFLAPFSALAAAGAWLGRELGPRLGLGAGAGLAGAVEAGVATVAAPFQAAPRVPVLPAGVSAQPAAASLPWAAALAGIALLGSAVLLGRWALRWRRLARLAREGEPRELGGLRAVVTAAAVEPGVFGIRRPVLLLPAGLEAKLSPAQLEAVLAHERCHLRRRDNLWAALHMLVEALFWYFPPVWWLGGKLVAERERACDEAVLGAGGDREAYAGGLLAVCRFYVETPLRCAAGVSGGKLSQRVRTILDGGRGRGLSRAQALLLGSCGALALLGPLAAGMMAAPAAGFNSARIAVVPDGPTLHFEERVNLNGRTLIARGVPLRNLIQLAYGLQPYQIEGPRWLATKRFNLRALAGTPGGGGVLLARLRPLLRQRFALQAHAGVREKQVYVLRVAPGGPRLVPALPGRDMFFARVGSQSEELSGTASMARLAAALAESAGRPLLDGTALGGNYAIQLRFAPRAGQTFGPGLPAPAFRTSDAPPLATALERQLGLRLVAARMPIRMLIIDHVDKVPLP